MEPLNWIVTNAVPASAVGYAVLNLLNAALPPKRGWAGNVLDKAHILLDTICLIGRKGTGGVKLPGMKTKVAQ